MQEEHGRVIIHTGLRPQEAAQAEIPQKDATPVQEAAAQDQSMASEQKVTWESLPHPLQKQKRAYRRRRRVERSRPDRKAEEKLTPGERLVRNSALACALLLSVLALSNVDQPWSQRAVEGVRQVVNMRVDWDHTLGRLSFVRALVPDTALVFLNLGNEKVLTRPVSAQVSHGFDERQPWQEYACGAGQPVLAALDGTVQAVGQGMSGDWTVLIAHDEGLETVYGYLAEAQVQVGQTVKAGDPIGKTAEENARLYFELCEDGASVDPAARMS